MAIKRYIRLVKNEKGKIIQLKSKKQRKLARDFYELYGGWGSKRELKQFENWLLWEKKYKIIK